MTAIATFAYVPRRKAYRQSPGRRLRPAERAAFGATLGAGAAWLAWMLWRPLIGIDGVTYQLAEAVSWVNSGRAGAAVQTFYDVPTASYPLTNEVLLSWLMGISQTLAAGLVLTPFLAALLVASAWLGLRRLGAPRGAVALAIAALLSVPFVVTGVPSRARTFPPPLGWPAARPWWPRRCGGPRCWARHWWPPGSPSEPSPPRCP